MNSSMSVIDMRSQTCLLLRQSGVRAHHAMRKLHTRTASCITADSNSERGGHADQDWKNLTCPLQAGIDVGGRTALKASTR